jgi:hypothetical protein
VLHGTLIVYSFVSLVIFCLEKNKDWGYFDMLGTVIKLLSESVKLEVFNDAINYVTRLGKRRGQ